MKQYIAPLLLMLVPGLAEAHDPEGMVRLIVVLLVLGQLLFSAVVASCAAAIAFRNKRRRVFALAFVGWPLVLATVVGLRHEVLISQYQATVSARSVIEQFRFSLDQVIKQILGYPLPEMCISAILVLSGVVVWRLYARKVRDTESTVGR